LSRMSRLIVDNQSAPTRPEAVASGLPALRVLISDFEAFTSTFSLCSLCALATPELYEGERARGSM
jgi:hypothetical protein